VTVPAPLLATADDAAAIGAIMHRCATEFDEPTPGAEVLAERARQALLTDSTTFVLAGAAGFAQVRFRPSVWSGRTDCHLEDLYVIPPERGRGIGRALLDRAVELAGSRGASHVELATGSGDVEARGLYETSGFTNLEDGEPMLFYMREL
jgi:GNAT superfamily N-acetyltransferase